MAARPVARHAKRFPALVSLLIRLPPARLQALADELGVSLAGAIGHGDRAGIIRDSFDDPMVLRAHLTTADLQTIGESITFGTKAAWQAKHPGEDFDATIAARIFQRVEVVDPVVRAHATRDVAHVGDWPELASVEAWRATRAPQRKAITAALARAFGAGFVATAPTAGALALPRVEHRASGIAFVAIPGGAFRMGLSPADKKAVQRIAKPLGEEAIMHAKDLASSAAPPHEVTLPAFLCSVSPVTVAQARRAGWSAALDATPVHDVALVDAAHAADVVAKLAARLLTEAEWEYVARGGSDRLWLSGDAEPAAYVRAFLASALDGDRDPAEPFAIAGLPWGTWIDDSWSRTYKGAPADGSAREPHERPEVVRGGGAPLSYPWQVAGEVMLLLTVHRDRVEKGAWPIVVARDLPPRRPA